MKKLRTMFASMLAMVSLCVAFTSCGSDDDENVLPAAQLVAGTYVDDMTCTVMGEASTYEGVTVTVAVASETTVNIVLPGFGEPPMQLPSITVEGVRITGDAANATIAEQEFSGTLANGKTYTCTLAGSYNNGKLMLNYSLKYGAMPMAMVCTFAANKK